MITLQNTQTLQLFTKIIKKERIYKSFKNAKLDRPSGLNKMREEAQAL
jgi:hypothetical protein